MTLNTTEKEVTNSVTCSQTRPEHTVIASLSLSGGEVQSQLATNGKFMFTFDIPCFSLFYFHSCKLSFYTQADSQGEPS